jgi:molecular chaperone DnaK
LGTFKLDGIAPAPRGTPQIDVTFDIDANGILNVSAKDQGTGKDQKITISGSSSMDEAEVERLKQEAEKFAEQDKEKKESIQVRNELDSMVYQSEKQLAELNDQAPDELKDKINDLLNDVKKVLDNNESTISELTEAKEKMKKNFEELGKEAMKYASPAGGDTTASSEDSSSADDKKSKNKDEDIVDADFEVVDDENDKEEKAEKK